MTRTEQPAARRSEPLTAREPQTLTEHLALTWAHRSFDDLSAVDVAKIKDNILDTLAVAMLGSTTEEATKVISALTRGGSTASGSVVWGTGHRLIPAQAALANGTSAHARDFDDGGGPGHAGSTVIPAALAIAEDVGSDGRALIASIVAGYDIGFRVIQALGGFPVPTDRGWHTSGSLGSFAAAAAAAKGLGLDADRFADALGIAGSFTGGVWAFIDDGAMTKRLHPGKAGETGVDAAFIAEAGFTGPRRIFEAAWGGIYSTYNGGESHPERALENLGTDFSLQEAWIKPYACCRGSHSTIDAVLGWIRERDVKPEDVHRIDIVAAETAVNMLSIDPIETVFDAQFSLPYSVSIALHERTLGLDQYDPPRIGDARIRETFDRITMRADPAIRLIDGPTLHIELTNGETVTLTTGNPADARGSKVNPLAHSDIVDKAQALLAPLGAGVAERLVRAVENLDQAPDLSELNGALGSTTR